LRISTPFISEDERIVRAMHENKRKWIVKKNFMTSVGKASTNRSQVISNYVGATPSQFPLLHKFREVDKKKWVAPKNFVVV
jgi:hypothetical protein